MQLTIVSKRNSIEKATIALLERAKRAGYSRIGTVEYELLPPNTAYVHKYTTEAM